MRVLVAGYPSISAPESRVSFAGGVKLDLPSYRADSSRLAGKCPDRGQRWSTPEGNPKSLVRGYTKHGLSYDFASLQLARLP